MKILFPILLLSTFFICTCKGKKNSEENEVKELRNRFSGYVNAIAGMNIDSIQNYTYPKLFTILPRSQSRQSMEKSYAFFKERAELDSVLIDTLYPVSHIDKGSYSIAIYSAMIRMPLDSSENIKKKNLTDTMNTKHLIGETYPAPQSTLLATLMKGQYGIEFTDLKEVNGMRIMRMKVAAIAAKDENAKDWCFFAIASDQELINKLFSRKVLEKLSSYNKNE